MEKARRSVPRAHFFVRGSRSAPVVHALHDLRGLGLPLSAHFAAGGLRYSLWQPPQLETTFGHSALKEASSLMAPSAALASAPSLSKRAIRSVFFSKAAGSASVSPVLVSSGNSPLALTAVSWMVFSEACTLGSSNGASPFAMPPGPLAAPPNAFMASLRAAMPAAFCAHTAVAPT